MYKIRSFEGNNNTYYFVKVAKTTYEQQQEQREERIYMIRQKIIGGILSLISIAMIWNGLFPAILSLLVGIGVMITKDHVTG